MYTVYNYLQLDLECMRFHGLHLPESTQRTDDTLLLLRGTDKYSE